MKSLKMICLTTTMFYLSACSQGGFSGGASTVTCDDRLCSMSENITLDQSDITGAASYTRDGLHAQGLFDNLLSLTPTLTLISTLAPPTVNGTVVQASDITVSGTKVYVAYNTAGEIQSGAIDVIDVANPNAAVLSSQALYPTSDIHKVFVNSGKLYAAGATSLGDGGAILHRITLDASGKLTSTIATASLRSAASASVAGYAGVSVVAAGNNIYTLSGNNGGISVLDATSPTLALKTFFPIPEARDISLDSTAASLYVVTGKTLSAEAAIKHLDLTGAALGTGNITLTGATIDASKSTIQTGSTAHVVTAGAAGAKLICLADNVTLGTAPNPAVSGIAAANQAANAVAFGGGYMFVANGEAGVSVYAVNTPLIPLGCNLVTITNVGRFSLGGATASANNVYYSNGHLVVATGSKGFKIIKVTTSLLSGILQAL